MLAEGIITREHTIRILFNESHRKRKYIDIRQALCPAPATPAPAPHHELLFTKRVNDESTLRLTVIFLI